MKFSRLFLFALSLAAAYAPAVFAGPAPVDWAATVAEDQEALLRAPRRHETRAQAPCRDVEVDVDEGYGVSSRETRYVCDPAR